MPMRRWSGRFNVLQGEVSAVMDYVSRLRPPKEKLAQIGWENPDFPSFSRHNLPVPMILHEVPTRAGVVE